jgi:hypothetical protein
MTTDRCEYWLRKLGISPWRSTRAIAKDLLECSRAWSPEARVLGNVTAAELRRVAALVVATGPKRKKRV